MAAPGSIEAPQAGTSGQNPGQAGSAGKVERLVHVAWRVQNPQAGLRFVDGYVCTDGQVRISKR